MKRTSLWVGVCAVLGVFLLMSTATAGSSTLLIESGQPAVGSERIWLSEALDNQDLDFFTDTLAPWHGQREVTFDGEDAARSAIYYMARPETGRQGNALPDAFQSYMGARIDGPAALQFHWKLASGDESTYDAAIFAIDQFDQFYLEGHVDWRAESVFVPDGPHFVTWTYLRNESNHTLDGAAWVDQVRARSLAMSLIRPAAGDLFYIHGDMPIEWDSDVALAGPDLRLELWDSLAKVADLGVVSEDSGRGATTVVVPDVPPRDDYTVRAVSVLMEGADRNPDYVSAGPIAIDRGVKVFAPAGGEVYEAGTAVRVEFFLAPVFAGSTARLELCRDGAVIADLGTAAAGVDGHGSAQVDLPGVPAGEGYAIRVHSQWLLEHGWDNAWAQSGSFAIYVPQPPVEIDVIRPETGDTWYPGCFGAIEWRVSDVALAGSAVKIELWRDGAKVADLCYGWNPEGHATTWCPVPDVEPGDDYTVRVYSAWLLDQGRNDVYGESAPFAIGAAVEVVSDLSGAIWTGCSIQRLHWRTYVPLAGTAVRIELWNGDGKVCNLRWDWAWDGDKDSRLFIPWVEPRSDYFIRVRSAWLSYTAHEPSYADSAVFGIGEPEWLQGGGWDGFGCRIGRRMKVDWSCDTELAGTAVRLELWHGNYKLRDLGVSWSAEGRGRFFFDVPDVPPSDGYQVRVVSLWLESEDMPDPVCGVVPIEIAP